VYQEEGDAPGGGIDMISEREEHRLFDARGGSGKISTKEEKKKVLRFSRKIDRRRKSMSDAVRKREKARKKDPEKKKRGDCSPPAAEGAFEFAESNDREAGRKEKT